MADVKVTIIGEDKASAVLAGVDKSLSGFSKGIKSIADGIKGAGVAVTTFGATFKAAFELGEQGAAVTQTAASFDTLINKVGASTDLLEQLREASRGTVDDMTLMTSTTTLLAGAEDELAGKLAQATPELLKIAKAANKLNPALGDTNFMYQSLALGIKRASPLILDNLGLTIKIGEANQKMADTLGKTVEELTATEQKQALLNATLDAGAILMEQAGGSADSATDAYARLDTNVKNVTDSLKAALAPALADAAGALSTLLTARQKIDDAAEEHQRKMLETAGSYEEYARSVLWAAKVQFALNATWHTFTLQWDKLKEDKEALIEMVSREGYETGKTQVEQEKLAATVKELDGYTGNLTNSFGDAIAAAVKAAAEYAKLREEMEKTAVAAGVDGKLQQGLDDYNTKIDELKVKNSELADEMQRLVLEGADPAGEEIANLTRQYNDNVAEAEKLRKATNLTTKEFIYQQAVQELDASASLELGRALGLVSERDYLLTRRVQDVTQAYKEARDETGNNEAATASLVRELQLLAFNSQQVTTGMDEYSGSLKDAAMQAKFAAEQTYRLQGVNEALQAGLSGTLRDATAEYSRTLADLVKDNDALILQYADLTAQGIPATADEMMKLTEQINANNKAQLEAQAAMKRTTAEMIYQRASQGLNEDAALYMARSMGLISEEDYKVMAGLEQLRAQFDVNRDGMISAAEGAMQYAAAVSEMTKAVQAYQVAAGGETAMGAVAGGIYTFGAGNPWTAAGSTATTATSNGVTINYAPTLSTASQYELEQALGPIIRRYTGG